MRVPFSTFHWWYEGLCWMPTERGSQSKMIFVGHLMPLQRLSRGDMRDWAQDTDTQAVWHLLHSWSRMLRFHSFIFVARWVSVSSLPYWRHTGQLTITLAPYCSLLKHHKLQTCLHKLPYFHQTLFTSFCCLVLLFFPGSAPLCGMYSM